jgi:hypothetical protein
MSQVHCEKYEGILGIALFLDKIMDEDLDLEDDDNHPEVEVEVEINKDLSLLI